MAQLRCGQVWGDQQPGRSLSGAGETHRGHGLISTCHDAARFPGRNLEARHRPKQQITPPTGSFASILCHSISLIGYERGLTDRNHQSILAHLLPTLPRMKHLNLIPTVITCCWWLNSASTSIQHLGFRKIWIWWLHASTRPDSAGQQLSAAANFRGTEADACVAEDLESGFDHCWSMLQSWVAKLIWSMITDYCMFF